jgi:hypothetical protein
MYEQWNLEKLSDETLIARIQAVARDRRAAEADLLALLAEVEARELHLALGYSSLFQYAVEALHLSECAARHRIHAARLTRRWPKILAMVAEGALHVSALNVLAPHLREDQAEEILAAAGFVPRSKLDEVIARFAPRAEPMPGIRAAGETQLRLAAAITTAAAAPDKSTRAGARSADIEPVAGERFAITLTVDRRVRDKLVAAQALLRHAVPNGDEAEIFERALDALLEKARQQKFAKTESPRAARPTAPGSRHIPAPVKRAVAKRDGERCSFVGKGGRRCTEAAGLEYHHEVPYAQGGPATVGSISLLCRVHNQHVANRDFGRELMDARRRGRAWWQEDLGKPQSTPASVMSGLVNLGLGKKAARELVEAALAMVGEDASVETLLRAALRHWPRGAREQAATYRPG